MSKKCTPLWREAHFEVKMLRTPGGSDHFWRFQISKKCTPLWHEAHFEVKMLKAPGVRTTFGGSDVEKVHAVEARSTFRLENVQNTRGFGPLLKVQMSLRFTTLHYITLHYTPLHYITLHSSTVHYTTLPQYTPLH